MRNNKGQFICGESLSNEKKKWWRDLKTINKDKLEIMLEKKRKNFSKFLIGKKGETHPAWKGSKKTDKRDGYILLWCPDHPFSRKNTKGGGGYVLEHRLVMEKIIGRYLFPDEDVNHINGIKDDNRPENLRLVRHNAHYEPHICPKCSFEWWTR